MNPSPRGSVLAVAAWLVAILSTMAAVSDLPKGFSVQLEPARKTVSRIEAVEPARSQPDEAVNAGSDAASAAIRFISEHRQLFRLVDPANELRVASVKPDDLGFKHVRLAQHFSGLEVIHAEMLFHFNRAGDLYLVTANYIPTPSGIALQPKLKRAAAIRAAAEALSATAGDWPASLKIWPTPAGAGVLAYEVAATVASHSAWRVFVDAHTGRILDRVSTVYTAKP